MSQKRHKPGRTKQYRRKRTLATRPPPPVRTAHAIESQSSSPSRSVMLQLPMGLRRFIPPRIIGPGSMNWDSGYKLAVIRAYFGQIQREVAGTERFEVRLVPSRFT